MLVLKASIAGRASKPLQLLLIGEKDAVVVALQREDFCTSQKIFVVSVAPPVECAVLIPLSRGLVNLGEV